MVDDPEHIHLEGPASSVAVSNGSICHGSDINRSGWLRHRPASPLCRWTSPRTPVRSPAIGSNQSPPMPDPVFPVPTVV